MSEDIENNAKIQVALVILSVVGIGLVLLSTSRYGVGISSDSVAYISTARSLLSGNGYFLYDGSPFIGWPPLFPTVLAVLGLIGVELVEGVRFLNAFVFGLIIFTSGQLFLRQIGSKGLLICGTVSILLSVPILHVSTTAMSEPLFTLLAVLFVIYISQFLNEKRLSLLFLLSAIAALSCLQRYIGITIIMTGLVLIVTSMPKTPLLQRFKYAIVFGVISVTPLVIWFMRNHIVAVLPPWKATPIKQLGVADIIVFSILAGSCIPGMNEDGSCRNYRSTEI